MGETVSFIQLVFIELLTRARHCLNNTGNIILFGMIFGPVTVSHLKKKKKRMGILSANKFGKHWVRDRQIYSLQDFSEPLICQHALRLSKQWR